MVLLATARTGTKVLICMLANTFVWLQHVLAIHKPYSSFFLVTTYVIPGTLLFRAVWANRQMFACSGANQSGPVGALSIWWSGNHVNNSTW